MNESLKNILICLSNSYGFRQFHLSIDHNKYNVYYVGAASNLLTIPSDINCVKVEIDPTEDQFNQIVNQFSNKVYFDHILAVWEKDLLLAAKLREYWEVQGPKVEDVLKVRNKNNMIEAVTAHNIKVPETCDVETFFKLNKEPWLGRTILKPKEEAAGRGVQQFSHIKDFQAFFQKQDQLIKDDIIKNCRLEKYIDASVHHADGLVENSKVVCSTINRYIGTNLEYTQGKPAGSVQLAEDNNLTQWVQTVIKAVNISSGSFHLEFFYGEEKEAIFLEIANRCGGGPFVEEFKLKTGVYLPAAECSIYLKDYSIYKWQAKYKVSPYYYGGFAFPGHHLPRGLPVFENIEFIKNNPKIKKLYMLEQNKALPSHITYCSGEAPIVGIIEGENSTEVEMLMKSIFQSIHVSSKA